MTDDAPTGYPVWLVVRHSPDIADKYCEVLGICATKGLAERLRKDVYVRQGFSAEIETHRVTEA